MKTPLSTHELSKFLIITQQASMFVIPKVFIISLKPSTFNCLTAFQSSCFATAHFGAGYACTKPHPKSKEKMGFYLLILIHKLNPHKILTWDQCTTDPQSWTCIPIKNSNSFRYKSLELAEITHQDIGGEEGRQKEIIYDNIVL